MGGVPTRSNKGWALERIHELTKIDPWFLDQFADLVELRRTAEIVGLRDMSSDLLRTLKRAGFGDGELGHALGTGESAVREKRRGVRHPAGLQAHRHLRGGVRVVHALHVQQLRGRLRGGADRPRGRSIILGSGPNRIGQGIEFDYCCCHAVFGFAKEGFETMMINCNPETVSTDYDTADRLYFEPLTFEDVMAVIEKERQGNPRRARRRAVRRADAAQAGAAAAGGRRQDHRHLAGLDRPGRGPRAVRAAAVGPRHPAAGKRHGGDA